MSSSNVLVHPLTEMGPPFYVVIRATSRELNPGGRRSRRVVPILTDITNLSLSSGEVPSLLKEAVIRPSLKKPSLDPESMKNFRPISNLPYLSKVIERVVAAQFIEHCDSNNITNPNQSAYRKYHSTETVLTRVQNDILNVMDTQ